jgi:hypothetical protein
MLIECKHCGAPLDVRDGERTTRCKYCGTASRVKSLKTVSFQTPPDWRPPAQWTPPTHFAADSAKTLVYQATTAVRRIVRTIITLAILAIVIPIGAIAFATFAREKSQDPTAREALSAAMSAIQQARGKLQNVEQLAQAMGKSLLTPPGPDKLEQGYRQALGTSKIRVRRLVIHPSHASLVAADPKRPGNLDSYAYRGGVVSPPSPERVSSSEKKSLETRLFDFDEIPFSSLPQLVDSTVTELGYERGKVSHVIVERNLPFSPPVLVRVYVSGPRDSGRIDYLTSGKVHKIYR